MVGSGGVVDVKLCNKGLKDNGGVELDNMVVKDSVGLNSDVTRLSFTTGYRP